MDPHGWGVVVAVLLLLRALELLLLSFDRLLRAGWGASTRLLWLLLYYKSSVISFSCQRREERSFRANEEESIVMFLCFPFAQLLLE